MFLISHNQRPLLYALPLPVQLLVCQWISMKIQYAPPRCLKAQTLVASKMTTPLIMPQHFMVPMGEHGHVLPAQPTVEVAWHIRSIRCPSHEKPPNLCCRVHLLHSVCLLAPNFPTPLTSICFVSAGVRRLDPLKTTLRRSLPESVQYFIQLYQTEKWTLTHREKQYYWIQKAENTKYSSKEAATEPSPLRRRSDTTTPTDGQWHGSQWQRVRPQIGLQCN